MRGKYVMTDRGAILFPPSYLHSDFKHLSVTSAGEFSILPNGEVSVWGQSISLKKHSNKDDARIIEISLETKEWR